MYPQTHPCTGLHDHHRHPFLNALTHSNVKTNDLPQLLGFSGRGREMTLAPVPWRLAGNTGSPSFVWILLAAIFRRARFAGLVESAAACCNPAKLAGFCHSLNLCCSLLLSALRSSYHICASSNTWRINAEGRENGPGHFRLVPCTPRRHSSLQECCVATHMRNYR